MTTLEEYRADQLKKLNNYREKHGACALELDKNLNNYAQEWANNLASRNTMQHRSNNKYGENLFMGTAPLHHNAVKNWYDEISQYNFSNPEGNVRNFMNVGHFTANVWKSSKRVGFGLQKMGNGMYIVVANFDPAGNYVGQFGANVLPPGTKPPVVAGKKEDQKQTEPPPTSKLIFHIGFNCNNCEDDPIIGIRYQCTTCDDYDLCEKCHKKDVHKEHKMKEITKPQDVAERVNDIIKKFDVDGNGIIEYPEYWIMAKKLWKITDEKQIREGFDAIDKSGDGKITVQEFRDFYMGIANEDLDEYLDKMIKEFDVDGNGVIEYPEFWIMAKKLWKELDEKSIEHDFKTIDKSGDGKLSVDELRAYFKEHTSKKAPEKQEPKKEEPKKQEVHEKKEEKTKEDGANLFQKFTNVQPGGTTWYTTTNCSPQTFYYTSRGG